jgi:sterol desaturase/sphingolipid hydroxylase (fatty acid hydroxylase superfamily)
LEADRGITMDTLLIDGGRVVHAVATTTWLGSLVYRTVFVDPRARHFFASPTDYERYCLAQAHGMRYLVLAALVVTGASGLFLAIARGNSADGWLTLVVAKSVVWFTVAGLFTHISWNYWPRRVFITNENRRRLHREGFVLALAMIGCLTVGLLMGYWARTMA